MEAVVGILIFVIGVTWLIVLMSRPKPETPKARDVDIKFFNALKDAQNCINEHEHRINEQDKDIQEIRAKMAIIDELIKIAKKSGMKTPD